MQSTSWETLDWKKHKLESRLPGEISVTSDMQMTPPLWQKVKRNEKASWWKWKRIAKSWLKAQHSENEDHGIQSHHFMGNRWENSGNSGWLYFSGLQNHGRWWLQPWNQETLAPWKKSCDQPRQHIKKQSHFFADKICLVKAMVFPVVKYGCESWTIKRAECQRIDAFELWCWRRLLRVPWTARRSN